MTSEEAQKCYDELMEIARNRKKPEGYVEKHHVVPRSWGGSNEESNLVWLTFPEHFRAHYWLAVSGNEQPMWMACVFMAGGKESRRKEELEKLSQDSEWLEMLEEARSGHSKAQKGVPRSAATKAALSKALKGVPKSTTHIAAVSKALKGVPKSTTHIAAVSKALKGFPLSAEHKAALSKTQNRPWKTRRCKNPSAYFDAQLWYEKWLETGWGYTNLTNYFRSSNPQTPPLSPVVSMFRGTHTAGGLAHTKWIPIRDPEWLAFVESQQPNLSKQTPLDTIETAKEAHNDRSL